MIPKELTALKKTVLSAMLIAIGMVLPFLTGQIQQIGNMLLPMHIPIILCGFICGWQYGALAGFILPLLRSAVFTMPVFYPNAISMAFELCFYGLVTGLIYKIFTKKTFFAIHTALISAMISGRIVWGLAQMLLLGLDEKSFTWQMFISGAFFEAIPGIILQLVLIPLIMVSLHNPGLFRKPKGKHEK